MADNQLNWNGWVTPDLARNPGAAMDVLNSGTPNTTNIPVSHAVKGIGVQDAINDHIATNNSSNFWNNIVQGGVKGLSWLNKPLKEIQRDYKFVHSVYIDVGFMQGFLATAAIVGGGVGGALLMGPAGAALGADAAAGLERKLLGNVYKKSYQNSEDENYKISPGRDFSNLLATASDAVGLQAAAKAFKNTNAGIGKVVSGVSDFGFAVEADPFMAIGRFAQFMKAGKYLGLDKAGEIQIKYPLFKANDGVKNFMMERSGAPLTSDQMDLIRKGTEVKIPGVKEPVNTNSISRQYNNALDDIVKTNLEAKTTAVAAGQIAVKYPSLGTIAPARLAEFKTADEVHNFFKTSLYFGELRDTLAGQAMLPSRTLLRAKASDTTVANVLRNANVQKYITDVTDPTGKAVIQNPKWQKYGIARNLSKVYNTFTGYMPYSIDPKDLKLSLNQFRWNANDAVTVVYRIARIGMGDLGAKEMAGQYAQAVAMADEAGLGLARSIKNHTVVEALKALGMPNADNFVKDAYDAAHSLSEPLVSSGIYGVNTSVEPIGTYISSEGIKNAGVFARHAEDMFTIPDFLEVKKAMRDAGTVMKAFGKLDEWTSKYYINKVFKPLALGTAGFGLRVSAAELLPTFARYGILNTIQAKIAVSAAKSFDKVSRKEAESIASASLVSLGAHEGIAEDVMKTGFPAFKKAKEAGLKFASKLVPEEQLQLAIDNIRDLDGHFITEPGRAGHGGDVNQAYQMGMSASYTHQIYGKTKLFKEKEGYTTYSPSDIHFGPRYTSELNKAAHDAAQRNIATDLLSSWKTYIKGSKAQVDNVAEKATQYEAYQNLRNDLIDKETARMQATVDGKYEPYQYEKKTLSRWVDSTRDGTLRAFAQDRVDATLGSLIGQDGTLLDAFAGNVSKGVGTDFSIVKSLQDSSPLSLPGGVAGPNLEAYFPAKDVGNWLVNITNLGFKKVIDPIVNGLSREPLFMLHLGDAYARLKPMVSLGYYTEEQARRVARVEATYSMMPQIHNVALRSQFAQLARNFLPFYFAQEQAIKRAYNSLKDTSIGSPLFSRGMRFYQIAEQTLNDPSFVQTNDSGSKYIYIPAVGEFGNAVRAGLSAFGIPSVSGLPVTGMGNLVSLKSVLPELQTPGVAPFLAVSGNILADIFPELNGPIKGAIGDISFNRSALDTIIPATWFKTAMAAAGGPDFTNQQANALNGALAAAYFHGKVPDSSNTALERQQFVDQLKGNVKSILIVKAFLGLISPLSPSVTGEDAGFRDEFWKLFKAKGNFADALLAFQGEHGSRAVSYTVAKTESNLPGLHLPYVQETLQYIKDNKQMFNPTSGVESAAYYLIPQDNATNISDRAVFNDLVRQGLRKQRQPEELLKQFYIAEGSSLMNQKIDQHLANLEQYKYIPALKKIENDNWSQTIQIMKNFYPVWYEDYTSGGSQNAQTVVKQLNKIFTPSNPNQPNHEQAVMVKDLLQKYNNYASSLASYSGLGIQPIVTKTMKDDWQNYLLARAKEEPRLASVINSVFMKLG